VLVSRGAREVTGLEPLDPARLERDAPLARHTTFRIGGPADLLYTAIGADDLAGAVLAARAAGLPHVVLGHGANVLVGDRGFRGLVIVNRAGGRRWPEDGRLTVETGAALGDAIEDAVARGRSGLEHFAGIPGTVGGALWQNVHFLSPAPRRERTVCIAEVFESCEVLTAEGDRRTVGLEYVRLGYDDSVFQHRDDVALAATFRLPPGEPAALRRVMAENLCWRAEKHPPLAAYPSAGSVFRKVDGVGAGRLVDQCGLKGRRAGDAQISPRHANIIVNLGGATARDVRSLVEIAQRAVLERFGVRLEPEIRMLGEF
jgi:UDP-N-acetylmuramate dehydrogenase